MNESTRSEVDDDRCARVLFVSPLDEDVVALEHIFSDSGWTEYTDCKWTLRASPTLALASTILRQNRDLIPIVLCERDLLPGSWKDMLEQLTRLPDPALLIVTSRLADEHLWAEALNLGAYDVLAKPFDRTEVVRIVSLAWLHWKMEHDILAPAEH